MWDDIIVEADLGGVDLPLDDVEDGDVTVLVSSAQVFLNTSADLTENSTITSNILQFYKFLGLSTN